jgi:hypothetical protein
LVQQITQKFVESFITATNCRTISDIILFLHRRDPIRVDLPECFGFVSRAFRDITPTQYCRNLSPL